MDMHTRTYRADLHIHTALSPCASEEMTPPAIVAAALEAGLDMIAVSDHNSTGNVAAVQRAAEEAGGTLTVIAGMEITSAEKDRSGKASAEARKRFEAAEKTAADLTAQLESAAEDKLAEENFRRALELDRNDSEARTNFGWFLCTRGRYDEGLEQFSIALRNPLYGKPEQAMANAGLCAERKGDLALAEANLMKSLKLQPDNPNTVLKLAGLHFRQGRLEETQRLLGRHAELAPPTAESLWLGVRLERKLGDRAQEAAYGLQLRKRFPDSEEARRLLAGRYE